MLGGSFWQRSLAFTPWSSCVAGPGVPTESINSLLERLEAFFDKVTYPCSFFGVKGKYFEVALITREVVETALQTVQAYRMSALLPRALLNRFYVILLAVNCWSSPLIDIAIYKRDEVRRRFACIVLDCLLDLMACMGIELIVLLEYVKDYNPGIQGFNGIIWYNDEWVARALNEFQMIVVVSWSDLLSRTMFSLGLIITTASLKTLMSHQPRSKTHISQVGIANAVAVCPIQRVYRKVSSLKLIPATDMHPRKSVVQAIIVGSQAKWRYFHGSTRLLLAAHTLFCVWGVVILGLHIHASTRPTLPQCLIQVRPWGVSRPSCYLAGLDCHTLGISGSIEEVEEKWREFDSSTVVQLLIRHCPALEVPDIFSDFYRLRGIKVYNTTIITWGESAAITNANHPEMATLFIVRVNMTDGLLPPGFQAHDFPQCLTDIEICVTNLRDLPDDLDEKWQQGTIIQVEYSQFETVPSVLARLNPFYLYLTGNPMTELPPEIFEVSDMVYLGVGDTSISELPPNVTNVSPSLSIVEIDYTNISFFWSWVDELVGRPTGPALFVAGGSPYCEQFSKIEDNTTDSFGVPLSPQYSTVLMDPSNANRHEIARVVNCDSMERGPYYPLAFDDSINAISTPPTLTRQRHTDTTSSRC
ncbi:hypothetical protein ON010_g6807 [Phytophthora cinnamomi]|nr:hypothetical protein ON010_g6807 [Phytophthora cinnamomi]